MKKSTLLIALLLATTAGFAQESRQDVSLSANAWVQPQANGNAVSQNATISLGALASYRFMLTPRGALEANYSFTQDVQKYIAANFLNGYRIHSRMQELTAAYVLSFNYKNFNPFVEVGGGGVLFTPINDFRSTSLGAKSETSIAGLYGFGIAYEVSPSFDVRVEYRALVLKTPSFGNFDENNTNTYNNISMPALGIAYHF